MYTPRLIHQQLQRILDDSSFRSSERACKFLQYIVTETLSERTDHLKEWTIALDVFGKGTEFNPQIDPIVRIEAGRLRKRLAQYYEERGRSDPIRIVIPKGRYVPQFFPNTQPDAAPVESQGYGHSGTRHKPVLEIASFHTGDAGEEDPFMASFIREELIKIIGSYQTFSITLHNGGNSDYRLNGRVLKQRSSRFLYLYLIHPADEEIIWSDNCRIKTHRGTIGDEGFSLIRSLAFRLMEEGGIIYHDLAKRLPRPVLPGLGYTEWKALFLQHRLAMTEPDCRNLLTVLHEHNHLYPGDPELLIMEAHLYWDLSVDIMWEERKNLDENTSMFQRGANLVGQVIRDFPENGEANVALARQAFYKKEKNKFYHYSQTALEVGLDSPLSMAYLAWLTALSGDWVQGLALLNRYRSRLPYAPGWFSRADCQYYIRQMDYEVVLEKARDFSFPHNPWYHIYCAAAFGLMGKIDDAHTHYTNLLALEPRFPRVYAEFLGTYIPQEEIYSLVVAGLETAGLNPAGLDRIVGQTKKAAPPGDGSSL